MAHNTLTHTVNGKEYEIRSMPTIEGLVVASFRNGKRISPRYEITWETASDFNYYNEQHALDMLIELAKGDLDDGIVK
jgi:hypothetical protein